MTILVTGATGFIGNHLINKLLKDKSINIIATSKDIDKARSFEWFNKVKYIEFDFNNNLDENIFNLFDKPDKLIHLAWEGLPDYNDLIHIERNLVSHYKFIKNIVSNGLKEIIVTGTCLEYGIIDGCLSEDINTNPSNSYAIAKDTLRKIIVELKKEINFDYKWIRLFYMYGKGQSEKSILSLLDKAIENGDDTFNMSEGEQLRDYLSIEEIVTNIILIINQKSYINESINCCSGSPISIRRLVENHLNQKNYKITLNLGYYPYPNYEAMAFWGDNSKLNKIKDKHE